MEGYNFSTILTQEGTIAIETNTSWSCKAEGNFMLSTYCGNGNSTVNIILQENMSIAEGVVYFSYGSNKCKIKGINVYYANNCYIETIPSYDSNKTITLCFNEPNELLSVSVKSFNEWTIVTNGVKCIKHIDGIDIITPDSNEETPTLTIQSDGCDDVTIILLKKND